MITTLLKRNQVVRIILVLTITCITTLVLFFGSIALHVSSFSPFSFAHAATTCATTKGTQPTLCEQQNPVEQGCTQDAHAIEVESVYTNQNTLIGEVDVIHSATCNTYWVRTVAYASAQQVQAIDALISFHSGKIERIKKMASSNGKRIIATTHMLFGPPAVSLTNWRGMFYLKGQTQPISIPTYITLAGNKGLMNPLGMPIAGSSPISSAHAVVIGKTVTQVPLQTPCASHPTGPHCNNQNPIIQGCNRDAQTLSYIEVRNLQGALLATVQRRYSPTCSSEWGRILESPNDHQPISITIANHETRSSPGSVVFSTMVFVPNLSIASQIMGGVSIKGISSFQIGDPGLTAFLPALPATKM